MKNEEQHSQKSGKTSWTSIRKKVDRLVSSRDTLRSYLKRERENRSQLSELLLDALEAQKICQLVSQSVQQQAHDRIASVVSRCLAAVFDDPYQFKIVFEQKRGRTEARLVFERDGNELEPLDESGGGAIDVGAFALRLACLLLLTPSVERVIVMDEAFRFVSDRYRSRLRALLETLSKEMQVQFIHVTHIPELKVGNVIHLENKCNLFRL